MTTLLKSVLEPYDYIDFALLFGSYVSGKQHAMSDVDIAIMTEKPIDLFEYGRVVAEIEGVVHKKVDLVLLNGLEKENPKLAFAIVDNHRVIFNRNRQKYIDFKTDTYKYYFDHLPMYEMFDRALKKRIADGSYGKAEAPRRKRQTPSRD